MNKENKKKNKRERKKESRECESLRVMWPIDIGSIWVSTHFGRPQTIETKKKSARCSHSFRNLSLPLFPMATLCSPRYRTQIQKQSQSQCPPDPVVIAVATILWKMCGAKKIWMNILKSIFFSIFKKERKCARNCSKCDGWNCSNLMLKMQFSTCVSSEICQMLTIIIVISTIHCDSPVEKITPSRTLKQNIDRTSLIVVTAMMMVWMPL